MCPDAHRIPKSQQQLTVVVADVISPGARPSSFVVVRPIVRQTPPSPITSSFSGSPSAGLPVAVSSACDVIGGRVSIADAGALPAIGVSLDAERCRTILSIRLRGLEGMKRRLQAVLLRTSERHLFPMKMENDQIVG